ncbi:MAG: PAS domain S-box protein [Planctomycetota bacterium]|nr:MAG: PAS domain S-box protein [Planctomycetota bacterium]
MLQKVKQFLTAEEVPRWFGLSVVMIYLVGLGAVAQYGIVEARREGIAHFVPACRYALQSLADRLGRVSTPNGGEEERRGAYHRLLRQFAAAVPAYHLRIVDGTGRVVASRDPGEVGKDLSSDPYRPVLRPQMDLSEGVASSEFDEALFYRFRLPTRGAGDATAEEKGEIPSTLYLEATVSAIPLIDPADSDLARVLAIVLVVLGALFVVYRALREHMHGVSRVAERLRLRSALAAEQLNVLRIEDARDAVAKAWNDLIDLVESLHQDVQRREADAELAQILKNARAGALGEALNAVPDGIVYVEESGELAYANTAACRMFGWEADRVCGCEIGQLSASGPGARILEVVRGSRQGGRFEPRNELIDGEAPAKEGEEASGAETGVFRVGVFPLKRSARAGGCVVIVRDVSQQVRAERAREEFMTQVTHELRTPLTNIRAYADTLSSGMFDDPKVVTECYNVITKETRRLARLIEDILSVSQLEVGSVEIVPGRVDLARLLSEGVRDVRQLAEEKNIDLQLVLPPKLEPIQADRDKLAVVINNLLGNAIKYTPADGNIVVGCQVGDGEVVITFKDNGIGIDPADQSRIFEKFARAKDPQVQTVSGTGIGLYTAREIVRRHGGDIEVISRKGEGSTFLVRLPHTPSRATLRTTSVEV